MTSQFEGAERIAEKWGITRGDADGSACRRSSAPRPRGPRAASTGSGCRSAPGPRRGRHGRRTTHVVDRDEGIRETSLEKLATLKPVARRGRRAHRGGLVADLRRRRRGSDDDRGEGDALGLTPKARVVDTCLVGVDPVLMLTGPIDATQQLLAAHRTRHRRHRCLRDQRSVRVGRARVGEGDRRRHGKTNPNGGAIAVGHPLGGTGAILMTRALHELERTGGRYALISMCCGGGLGTGTIIERL